MSLTKRLWVIIAVSLLSCPTQVVVANEKCKIVTANPASDTEYSEQYVIDVDDMPGHQIRIFEIHNLYKDPIENCEGLLLVERISWGNSDYTNGVGRVWGYQISIFHNGDKIFSNWSGISQKLTIPQDGATGLFTGTITITGGTGVNKGVRGTGVERAYFNPSTGYNEADHMIEYWVDE